MKSRLYKKYTEEVVPALKAKHNFTNLHQIPKFTKIVVNMGISASNEKGAVEDAAKDLAAILHVHPSTLTGVLQRLVTQRLLTRMDDPQDRRRTLLRLTKRGRLANGRRHGTVEAAVSGVLARVADGDRIATQRVLAALATSLGRSAAVTSAARPVRKPRPRRG